MFESHEKSTGTGYTTTVALLMLAFIFSPAVLAVSRPFGLLSVSLAVACSALCIALAWVNWKKHSRLTMPSLDVTDASRGPSRPQHGRTG